MITRIVLKKIYINILLSVVTTLLVFITLEAGLRIYQYLKNVGKEDVLVPKNEVSDKTFNIYYFGESSMVGVPYENVLSIPKLVSYMLDYKVGDKNIHSINLAKSGQDFQYAFERLKLILKNKDIFYPSLCVIYCGHNEFLKYHDYYGFANKQINYNKVLEYALRHSSLIRTIVFRFNPKRHYLRIDERKFFDVHLYPIKSVYGPIDVYISKITEAIKLFHEYNVPCIISTVAGNYSDWEPNRSVFTGQDREREHFKELMDKGIKAQNEGVSTEALSYYLEALSLCDSFAETHYRLGKVYDKLGNYEKAWQEYQKAVNDDGMPIRATEEQNNFIRSIPNDSIVSTVDAVKYLRENADHGIIGFNLIADGQHPNLKAYILISELIAKKIKETFQISKQLHLLSEEEAADRFKTSDSELYDMNIRIGRWYYKVATWRYDPSERLNLAELSFFRAKKIDSSRYESYLGLAMCNFLRKDNALAEKYLLQQVQ